MAVLVVLIYLIFVVPLLCPVKTETVTNTQKHESSNTDIATTIASLMEQAWSYYKETPSSLLLTSTKLDFDPSSQQELTRLYQKVIELSPTHQLAHALLGVVLYKSNNISESIPFLSNALTLDKNQVDWVSAEYLATAYSFLSKRLYAHSTLLHNNNNNNDNDNDILSILDQSSQLFYRARSSLVKTMSNRGGPSSLPLSYPPLSFAQPRTIIYRTWGDILLWLKREAQARIVFDEGVRIGLWQSPWCRPATVRPMLLLGGLQRNTFFFDSIYFSYIINPFEHHLHVIRDEFLSSLSSTTPTFIFEEAGLHKSRTWSLSILSINGRLQPTCEASYPHTCRFLDTISELKIKNGQIKFSVMAPGTYVRPHAGPTNARLRMHCSVLLTDPEEDAVIRVGEDRRSWREGKCMVFDESCEHEVWQKGSTDRVVLIVDFANPLLSSVEEYRESFVDGEWDDPERAKRHEEIYNSVQKEMKKKMDGHNKDEL